MDKSINIDRPLSDVISETPFWKPFEQRRLSQIRRRFNEFSDSIYSACDDIAALVRCHKQTEEMGAAVVESTKRKHELHMALIHAGSLRSAIELLRTQLAAHKTALGG